MRGFDFPRMQFGVLAAALALVQILQLLQGAQADFSVAGVYLMLVVTLCCLGVQVWWILPFTRLHPVEVQWNDTPDIPNSIAIMTANVLTPNRNAQALLELVSRHDPDIVVTLESDDWWQQRLDSLDADYPYSLKCPLDNLYGMHLYSRLPLSDSHIEYLVESGVPSMHTLVQLRSGQQVRAHFLHPAPPSPTENEESSPRDAELIVVAKSIAKGLAKDDRPVIVSGDLNDVAWSDTTRLFRKISGLLDPRVGRGLYNTFHAGYWFLRWPLDHLFHSADFRVHDLRRLAGFGSDHFALFSRLVYQGNRVEEQNGLDAAPGDEAWANEKVQQHDLSVQDVPKPGSN
ncbi:endonuclease/exonuclease/phosphatase family protein [Marinobacterium rhizophilum]|uniref:endonuclease/exonuclease/phosphatase family protein n=1 Tax=Marinobacterium rhizophilum TaxID=420402 RepID=UPI0003A8FD64|nr:endonuclease/exonuclease/phosphatase family protein [Marinobacterium rhizophilum]